MVDLRGAVVVITGASSGIGQATAEAFARRGARLVLAARSRSHLEEVARGCRRLGGDAIAVPTDVTIPSSVNALVDRARAYGGGIDVWFSNVGSGSIGRFDETPIAVHEQVIRTNLISHMNDAHAVIPLFRRQGHGIFINMISLGGFAPTPYAASYSASKFGLRGFSEALRGEVSDQPDIHICDVYPTFVDAPGLRNAANYTGRRLSAPPPVYDPRKVAQVVIDLAARPRAAVTVGAPAHLVRLGHFLAPELSARIAAGMIRAYLARAPAAAITNGALFRPPERAAGIDGGLRSSFGRKVAIGISAAAIVVGAAVVMLRGEHAPRRSSAARR
jgi:short-subunit dehydrogenase